MQQAHLDQIALVNEPGWQSEQEAKEKYGQDDEPGDGPAPTSVRLRRSYVLLDEYVAIDGDGHGQIDTAELKEVIDGRDERYGLVNEVLVPMVTVDRAVGMHECEA